MSKTEVSSAWINKLKYEHANKAPLTPPTVLITGAKKSGSIGEEIALEILANEGHVDKFDGDVRSFLDRERYLQDDYSALVCSHGRMWLDWIGEVPPGKIEEVISTNLTGTLELVNDFVAHTLNLPWRKQIVLIGSMAHRKVLNGSVAYCASKAGLAMAVQALAWELAPKGFDVFGIHPGNTSATPMAEETVSQLMRFRGLTRAKAEEYWATGLPRERWLSSQDISKLVKALVFGEHTYLSGANLELAGGQR